MADPTHPLDRRTVLRSVMLAGGGLTSASVLAGCGGDEEPTGSTSEGSGGGGDQLTVPAGDIDVGGGVIVEDTYVVTQPTKGEFKAFTAICTHNGCPVASVSDGTIQCDCHGSQYDAATGEVTKGPATEALAGVPFEVKGSEITVG